MLWQKSQTLFCHLFPTQRVCLVFKDIGFFQCLVSDLHKFFMRIRIQDPKNVPTEYGSRSFYADSDPRGVNIKEEN